MLDPVGAIRLEQQEMSGVVGEIRDIRRAKIQPVSRMRLAGGVDRSIPRVRVTGSVS